MRRKLGMAAVLATSTLWIFFALSAVPAAAQPTVVSVENSDLSTVVITFSENIDPTSGNTLANYALFEKNTPSNTFSFTGASTSGAVVTLSLASPLTAGVVYIQRAQNVENTSGQPMTSLAQVEFTATGASTATPIADIQANPSAYDGQVVTVEGVVYIPSDYRGTVTSGYIQDSSNRGINLFGTGFDVPATQTVGNRVRVTGTVALYYTTVEIENPTEVTVLSSGNPRPTPVQLSTGGAANTQWEGTFIEITAPITAQAVSGPGTNYTVNDGSGPIDVRIVDTLGAPSFATGTTITARGAGGAYGSTYQVLVGVVSDVSSGGGPDTTLPTVTGASAASATSLTVNFSESLDSTSAQTPGNYQVFETATPTNTVVVSSASLTGSRVTLQLGSSLTQGTSYTVSVSNVQDLAGNIISGSNTAIFTYSGINVTPIADIQANPSSYDGQVVTVEGSVYIPSNYRGTTTSGFIQDSSGRGIDCFGNGFDVAAMLTLGNVVRVTGTVTLYFTTVEISNPTEVTLLSSGPRISPAQLSTGAAANSQWEGTFIEVTAPITAQAVSGPGINYTVNDGSGPIDIRVVDTLGADTFATGTTITARGAGGAFGSTYQVNVGLASDIVVGQSGDTTPPSIDRASLEADTTLIIEFNEALEPTSATTVGNYEVYRTGDPSVTVGVASASLVSGTQNIVRLFLDNAISVSDDWSVRVTGVADQIGNAIQPPGLVKRIESLPGEKISLQGPPFTFLPREGEQYPLTVGVTSNLMDREGEVILRIFNLDGTLVRTLYDSRVQPIEGKFPSYSGYRTTFEWDGKDDYGEFVPAGAYVAHLQTRVLGGSGSREVHIPVVVATHLDR